MATRKFKEEKMRAPSRKTFEALLFGVYNIAPEPTVEPGTQQGRIVNTRALEAVKVLYDLLDSGSGGAHTNGVLLVVRLLAETTCAKNPEAYAQKETSRGLAGDRHEEQGATICLPTATHTTVTTTSPIPGATPRKKWENCIACDEDLAHEHIVFTRLRK